MVALMLHNAGMETIDCAFDAIAAGIGALVTQMLPARHHPAQLRTPHAAPAARLRAPQAAPPPRGCGRRTRYHSAG